MKTLADFKRAIQIGTKWEGFNHLYKRTMGIREVSKVQSTRFAFRTVRETGEEVHSWTDFPKASDLVIREDGTVDIYFVCSYTKERKPMLSYKKVEA